jgi:hypothetical protein
MRRAIPLETEALVLVKSRRRCCLCFGLNRDVSIVRGQIAHVDRDAANSDPDNLAFLCLLHHDLYDSRSLQSKGMTPTELRSYRDELHSVMDRAFTQSVTIGGKVVRMPGDISGRYAWRRENDEAELQIQQLDGVVKVFGIALHGTSWPQGPHTGDLEFNAPLVDNRIVYQEEGGYTIELVFSDQTIRTTEANSSGRFGVGVSFAGTFALVD